MRLGFDMYMRIIQNYKFLLAVFAVLLPVLDYSVPAHADQVYDPNNLIIDSLFPTSNTMGANDFQIVLNDKHNSLQIYYIFRK